ncbi:S8 family serine peptidase [Actinomycetes bacterium KLBMP 9797]
MRENQWHLRYLHVIDAHQSNRGDGVTVAVVDTGVAPHPDLRENLLLGSDIVGGGSGSGQDEPHWHGTSMAGLVAAHGRGNIGALGIAPGAKVLPIRIAADVVLDDSDAVAAGVEWATSYGARVVSISNAGSPSPRLRRAVEAALREDVVVVAAVGNRPRLTNVGFPAALEGVVAVGATDRDGNHADISVTGNAVVISAPGVDIYSTSTDGNYSRGSGTSASTAIVAGAVALVRSRFPDLSASEVVHRLTATAVDKGPPGRDPEYGYGVLDLVAALTADVPAVSASAAPSATSSASPEGGGDGRIPVVLALVVGGAVIGFFLIRSRRRRSP